MVRVDYNKCNQVRMKSSSFFFISPLLVTTKMMYFFLRARDAALDQRPGRGQLLHQKPKPTIWINPYYFFITPPFVSLSSFLVAFLHA
jgi:hypothetical protein